MIAGKYQLGVLLGSGGMAEVWSATNTFTDRQVAIKFLRKTELEKTPEAAPRFLKEAKVSARINHPNVIDILDVGQTEDGQLFLVMELLRGLSLDQVLKRQEEAPLSLHGLVCLLADVASALAAAHRSGVVHRDLKPSNIFLHETQPGIVVPKVLDFGVGKFLDEGPDPGLTAVGTVLGSPLYMSPEQARGEADLDGRTDIFAFGAILFEAACGYRAYDAKNFNALIVKIATGTPKDIDLAAPHLPESFRRVVRGCLERERDKRIATFDEVLGFLHAALPDLARFALPPPSLPPPEPMPAPTTAAPAVLEAPPLSRAWWIAAAASAMALAFVIASYVSGRPEPPPPAPIPSASVAPPPPPAEDAGPPTMSIDALPVVDP